MEHAELTKSERERAAEALFTWRNQIDWHLDGGARVRWSLVRNLTLVLTLLLCACALGLLLRA